MVSTHAILKVSQTQRLLDIQKAFNRIFPFLSIQFYAAPHGYKERSSDADMISPMLHLIEVETITKEGIIEIDGAMTVGSFEQLFANKFGLNIQVFRKSGRQWLQTWVTDIWTLEEQNRRGKLMGRRAMR